ncbi:MAG: M50 family metallopeptidase [Eubacteriales bacterium]|nr:M50 family metallopeptidase [Bacillota bacterium]MBV1726995.1 M50 family metallopeptidase [Desulforudis sp.]MDP3051712.1 M50 family metallopeptidase [Eubacteriales bacterium]MDQ7789468.1 M50 family metallopeptidase [Clostridia bacterium]MBU4534039.1 M50 family metallopeptidase [Bacillota bacterium]
MKICRIKGVDFSINNWFIALIGVYFAAGVLDKGLVAFAVVLMHEMAHALVARRLDFEVSAVELLPFGGVARMSNKLPLEPDKEMRVAVAGPLTNLGLIFVALGFGHYGLWHDVLGPFFIQCNLILFLFNLLPGLPLDGGRVMRAYLARRMSLPAATCRMATFGQIWGFVVIALGTVGVLYHINGLDLVATGFFVYYAARAEKQDAPYLYAQHLMAKQQELLRRECLPGEMLVVLDTVPAWKVTRMFVPQRYHFIYLVDQEGSYVAMLDERDVVEAVIRLGTDVSLGQVKKDLSG